MAFEPLPQAEQASEAFKTIGDLPQAGQDINHDGKEYTTIKEGLAHILVPHGIPTSTDPKIPKEDAARQSVFYNPIQQFNRDLSVLAIKAFGEDLMSVREQMAEKKKALAEKKKARQSKRKLEQETNSDGRVDETTLATPVGKKAKTNNNGIEEANSTANGAAKTTDEEHTNDRENISAAPNADKSVSGEILPPGQSAQQTDDQEHSSLKAERRLPFKILDALSATGLRALRYAQEIPFVTAVTANDMSSKATRSIALNVKHNRLEDKIKANTGNAIGYMYGFYGKAGYDVIDLDPYGSAAPFLDSAMQALNDGGLLCVTCTDSAIFASHGYLEKTYSQYGGLPLKGEHSHEGGIRLILHAVATSAARYGIAIEPLLSLSIDYYIRAFIRIRKSPADVKFLAGKTMVVYNCDNGCGAWKTQFLARHQKLKNDDGSTFYKYHFAQGPSADQLCEHCGKKTHLSGPMYGGPLHNPAFIESMLQDLPNVDRDTYHTIDRVEGMLQTALDEITYGVRPKDDKAENKIKDAPEPVKRTVPIMDPAQVENHPFFFIPSAISKVIHCQSPGDVPLRGALRHAGFRVTRSHCKRGSIRTDASWSDIWYIMREWVRQKAPLKNTLKKETAGWEIMQKAEVDQDKIEPKDATTEITPEICDGNTQEGGKTGETSDPINVPEQKREEASTTKAHRFEVMFDEELGKDRDPKKYVRYQFAPRANWGPMSRAK